jgi:hypothetical protein
MKLWYPTGQILMYGDETNLYTWCSKILTSALFTLWCGATPCVLFRLKGVNSINVSVVEIFKKYDA